MKTQRAPLDGCPCGVCRLLRDRALLPPPGTPVRPYTAAWDALLRLAGA